MSAVRFEGAQDLRARIVCSILTGRPIRVDRIRDQDTNPGLREHEASLLRLVEKMTNGSQIEISATGTSMRMKPGVLTGGKIVHDCHSAHRGLTYFLEFLTAVAPWCKVPLHAELTGITNCDDDLSVDIFRTVTLPTLAVLIGTDSDDMELKIKKRGAWPDGGGEVLFRCPIIKQSVAVNWTDFGKVKRVRGIGWSAKLSPQMSSRAADAAKQAIYPHTKNVVVLSDHYKGEDAGKSPGFGVMMVAESTTGSRIGVEVVGGAGRLPEDCGTLCGQLLLKELLHIGCCDGSHQWLVFLYMALAPEDTSRLRVGRLSKVGVKWLRIMKKIMGVEFKIDIDSETDSVLLSCVGTGYVNVARAAK